MQLISLLSILPFLATLTDARTHHPNADVARRALHRGLSHERAAAEVQQQISRREALAAANPGEVAKFGKRIVKKRGAAGCRVRGSTFNTTSTSSTSAASTAAAASSTSDSSRSTAVSWSTAVSSTTDASSTWATAATTSASVGANFAADAASTTAASSVQAAWSTSSSAAAAASSSAAATSSSSSSGTTPNGKKAGVSAAEAVDLMGDHIGWWYDWDSTSSQYSGTSSATFASMLWGAGTTGGTQDATRLADFKSMTSSPAYILGTYEPDCTPPMSSGLDQATAAAIWTSLIVPHKASGSILVSPGMCKQADEDWLPSFKTIIGDANMWDVTALHINKLDKAGVLKDLDHYAAYGKPLWVTEFACVDDSNGFTPCTDQTQINAYINMIVPILEADSRVTAYSISCGEGLSDEWTTVKNGALTETGRTYLNAISAYH